MKIEPAVRPIGCQPVPLARVALLDVGLSVGSDIVATGSDLGFVEVQRTGQGNRTAQKVPVVRRNHIHARGSRIHDVVVILNVGDSRKLPLGNQNAAARGIAAIAFGGVAGSRNSVTDLDPEGIR